MALPASRQQFKDLCLRNLGAPVTQINLADEQIEDKIDLALAYYAEFHFDGTHNTFFKTQLTANVFSDAIHSLTLNAGGTAYSNTDTVLFTGGGGIEATANVVTNGVGTITAVNLLTNGKRYANEPTVTVVSGTGSGASITAGLGGYITVPENIIGIGRVFPFNYLTSSNDMFSVEYQFAMNNLYNLANSQILPYYMSMQHLQLFHDVLVGRTPVRYNKNMNRLYIDALKHRLHIGEYFIVEAFGVIDPLVYTDVWKDRMLVKYATALMKQQYGTNLSKFTGVMMPGGVAFDGKKMYDDATAEIIELEKEFLNTYSIPVLDIMG